jgi:3-oxoacyl-[acyl-carrier protein] reductase
MIAGLSGQTGAVHRAHVVTGKSGLMGLTKALALEYAGHNITVNAVSPGMIDTTRAGAEPVHHQGREIPVGRRGRPAEVASLVRYLVSDEAAFVTGQTLNINGGLLS